MKILIFLCISSIVGRDLTISHLSGAVEDIKCVIFPTRFECCFHIFSTRFECSFSQGDIETIHEANVGQLHNILEEISNTTYFRLVRVEPVGECDFFKTTLETSGEEEKCTSSVDQLGGGFSKTAFGAGQTHSFRV
jgi:hypothetical protein